MQLNRFMLPHLYKAKQNFLAPTFLQDDYLSKLTSLKQLLIPRFTKQPFIIIVTENKSKNELYSVSNHVLSLEENCKNY